MIEISFGKLLLLAVIALIVLGPEKLPHAARTAGALLRRLRSGWDSVRAEVERELEIEEIRRVAREAAAQSEQAQAKLDQTQAQINAAVRKVQGVANGDVSTLVEEPAVPPADTPAPLAGNVAAGEDASPLMTAKPLPEQCVATGEEAGEEGGEKAVGTDAAAPAEPAQDRPAGDGNGVADGRS